MRNNQQVFSVSKKAKQNEMIHNEEKIILSISDFDDQEFMIEVSADNNRLDHSLFFEKPIQFSSWKIRFRDEIVLENLSKLIQLIFLAQGESEGRVCFAESAELRPDFRSYFTQQDLKYYILGTLAKNDIKKAENSKSFGSQTYIPYPANADEFWNNIAEGEKITV